MHLSVVIPAYNESTKILRDLVAAQAFLEAQPFLSEVLVVDDGSQDDTAEVVKAAALRMSSEKVRFLLLSYGKNRGKGYAVRFGMTRALGENVAFVDAGLCVPYSFLAEGLNRIRSGADVAIASRRLAGTKIQRSQPIHRRVGSKVFGWGVRRAMGISVSDTQCGFKIYSAKAAKQIFSRLRTDGFMFDIEALITARKLGLTVVEFAVDWSNDGDTRYHPVWGTIRNFRELFKIRLRSLYGN